MPSRKAVQTLWRAAEGHATCGAVDLGQPDYNLRGRFRTDGGGQCAFRALRPVPYPVRQDETAGELLRFMGHHPYRPGHMHFMMAGYEPLISQIFDADSKWLDNDSVFAVRNSLVAKFEKITQGSDDLHVHLDFDLKPVKALIDA